MGLGGGGQCPQESVRPRSLPISSRPDEAVTWEQRDEGTQKVENKWQSAMISNVSHLLSLLRPSIVSGVAGDGGGVEESHQNCKKEAGRWGDRWLRR